MKHEITVLWQLHDLTLRVADALLEGLKKSPEADPNKFSREKRLLMHELAVLIHKNFGLQHMEGIREPEYQQVAYGLADAVGLQGRIMGYIPDRDVERYLERFCADLHAIAAGGERNHHDGIKRIFRICQALIGECRIACVVPEPEEIVMNEVDIGAEIHVG